MAVLKNLLVAAITCVAVIQRVAGAPAVKPFVSFTETMTSTVDLPDTTFTTTQIVTEAAGWHEQPPILALEAHTVPAHLPGHVPSLDASIVNERADPSVSTWVDTVPMVTVTATVDGPDVPVTTDAEYRNDNEDMTLSLTTSTTSHSSMWFTTIFPDPGIFGHPPPIETARTRLTAWTTPDFPVVPSVLPDGTKLRRYHAAIDTPGPSGAVTLPGKTIEGTPTDGPPIYPTTTYTTDSRSHRPTSSDNCPGVGEFGILLPTASGGRSHLHSSYTSWPRTCLPTNKRAVALEGQPEGPLTETRQPAPFPSWHGESGVEGPKQLRSIIERQSSGYDFGTSIPDFRTLTPTVTTWEGTSTAHRVASTKIIMHTAVMCPIHLPGHPQPLSEGGASLLLQASQLEDTVHRDEAARTNMAAPTDSSITSSIDFVRTSAVLHSSDNVTSEFVTTHPTTQPSSFGTTPSETPFTSETTVQLVTVTTTITCSTCGPCLMTGITHGPITVAHPPSHGGKPVSIWNGTMLPFVGNTLTTEMTTLETSVLGTPA